MSQKLARVSTLAAAGLIAAYFVRSTIGSLLAEFTHDDLMNCYRAWSYPLPSLLADNLFFFRFTPVYRPFGALVYKAFFVLFGFDLFPLRIVLLLALAANIFLIYELCRILTGSAEVGVFGAFISSYHMKLGQFYYNTGTLYDIFCFLFYFAALLLYIRVRRQGKNAGVLRGLAICVLYILALNSKELAASFPVLLAAYELLWHAPVPRMPALWRWLTRQTPLIWITTAITAAFVAGRVLFQERSISTIGDYKMTVSAGEYLSKLAHYLNEIVYAPDWLGAGGAAVFVVALVVAGIATRSRAFLFGGLLFLGGLLPMAFIPARALSAIYLPLAGLALCAAALLGFACDGLRRLSPQPVWQRLAFWLVFGTLGLLLLRVHPHSDHFYVALQRGEYTQIREAREGLQRLHPAFPAGSSILIVGTPFPQYSPGYNNMFMIRLAYRDNTLTVDELARFEDSRQAPLANYDYVVSYEGGRWVDLDPATLALPKHP